MPKFKLFEKAQLLKKNWLPIAGFKQVHENIEITKITYANCEDGEFETDGMNLAAYSIGMIVCASLVPVTLSAALLKTVVDINTRHSFTDMEMSDLQDRINNLTSEELHDLTKEIIKYSAKSNSSKELISNLKRHYTDNGIKQLLIQYLSDNKNSGKKLQHIIKDSIPAVDHIPLMEQFEVEPPRGKIKFQ